MKGSYRVSRILSCFMATCLLLTLFGCQSGPSPRETSFPSVADNLTYPNRVALLLPLTGELGSQAAAVRDGFFAAYYADAKTRTVGLPKITVFDTQNDKNVMDAYQKALAQGAEFIVGPLTKPGLETLMKAGNPKVPVLALNTVENASDSQIYQFGLSPENEAEQAAMRAYAKGERKALIFAQQGAWGERVADAFSAAFRRQGGEVADVVFFSPREDLSAMVRTALHIEEAQMAALEKARNTKTPVRIDIKPRDDVDMVFMAAMPTEARQIPPLLAFYFAKSWPIFATSSVYSGVPNPKMDQDLNGVTFCDIPWVVNPPHHDPLWPTERRTNIRLYAMGVDAYRVLPLLPHMARQSSYAFDGATGVLTLNDRQQIERTLPCTQFVRGAPEAISE